ncbi:hypothetical protein ISS30_07495 [bacterium]|nr:hypothetical protein [FCB group bacterium]MBL7191525.1 hypothetical protein [bacterium]
MNIEKIFGAGETAPNPKAKKTPKPQKGEFNQVFRQAVEKTSINDALSEISGTSLDEFRLNQIRQRIDSGFYNRHDTLSNIADKLLSKGNKDD